METVRQTVREMHMPIEKTRQTSSDDVFNSLYEQIYSQKLMPGDKVSEVEVAKRFDVSRQPVREAFIRLSDLDLLLISPQRATTVKKLSLRKLKQAQFDRLCIELQIARLACKNFDANAAELFALNLRHQKKAADGDFASFVALDTEFHGLMCSTAGLPDIFDAILAAKTQFDRVQKLNDGIVVSPKEILEDHIIMVQAMSEGDEASLLAIIRKHMARLDGIIDHILASKKQFFRP